VPYNFSSLPEVTSVDELRAHLNEELQRISQTFNEATELELRASKHAPDRPREGMIVHADGTSWDPGGGQGTYRYQGGLWVKVPIAGTDVVTGQASSVDGEIALFSGTSGKALKRATGSGLVRATSGVYSTDVAANADLADMAAWTIKMRNNGSTGDPQDQTINDLTEDTTPDASADFLATWDASASQMKKAKFSSFGGGGITLIADAVGFPAAATWSITSLGGYKAWMVDMQGVSQSSGTSRSFQAALSGNNGSSYGSVRNPIGPTGLTSGSTTNLRFFISRIDKTNNQMLWMSSFISGGNQIESGSLGPINAIQFSWSGAATNFTAGVADIYGIK
jgi:hypothetical protein